MSGSPPSPITNPNSPLTTRKRSRPPPSQETANNLPQPRRSPGLRQGVSPPFHRGRLSTYIYVLVALTALMGAYYSYRMVQYKTAVGGWWSLVLGRSTPAMYMPPQRETQPNTNWNGWRASKPVKGGGEDGVEVHIQGLAKALGMPTNELASAIASAVRAYVPPASLSSVGAKETGEAVKVLLQEPSAGETRTAKNKKIMDNIISGMDAVVGMDDG